ncbi:hypothetical protein [Embleya scabrispora]|uniref:hypothetical protein n=1 Tax=Embleya scabrispora TaxID=159449 RepID=UPI00037DCE5E|nr:hypothetical protein [Embleya scabrispora]MYS81147.1 hypothetical protein [Streptomyces sp. SID5474]
MDDNSTAPDPVVTRLTATLRAHADTVEPAHSVYESLRRDIGRARRRRLAACAAGVATIAVAGGIAFTSSGASLGEGSAASHRQAPWSACRTDETGRVMPTGATKALLARAIKDYGPAEGRDSAQRKLLEVIVCQVDYWAHGSDGLGFRVMWRGTFASGATGVVLRVTRGTDTVDFVNTSYGKRSHPAVPVERANEPSWLVLEVSRTVWETWAPPGSTVELYDRTTNRLIASGTANDKGYAAIFPDRPVDPAAQTRMVTVFPSGVRKDGPLPWTYGDPEECRVLFRTPVCDPIGPVAPTRPEHAPAARG